MTLCKCGCGGEAEPGNEYISGHQNRGRKASKETIQKKKEFYQTEKGKRLAKECGERFKGKEPWNKGETKETNEIVKESSEKDSKTKKAFFATEEGQEWLDENSRGVNSSHYGKSSWKKGKTKNNNEGVRIAGEKCSKTKKEFFQTEEGRKLAEECGNRFRGKKPWNYGKTKDSDDMVKKYGEKQSKTKTEFYATEEGQQWLDDNIRGENAPMYGKEAWSKGLTKETNESLRVLGKKVSKTRIEKINNGEIIVWNKDKTKETDDRVKGYGEKISKTRKEKFAIGELVAWCKGLTKETDERLAILSEKVSKTLLRRYANGELKAWNKGETKETNVTVKRSGEKCSITKKAFFQTEEGRNFAEEISRTRKAYFATERGQKWLNEHNRGENHPMYGKHHTEEELRKMLKAVCAVPNKPEQYLYWILQVIFPDEYKFVGDGSVIIGGHSPDFININGQKKLIEHFGDYWHRGDDEGNRIFQFRLFGFDTLIIWEHELNDNEIEMTIAKIIEFHYRK